MRAAAAMGMLVTTLGASACSGGGESALTAPSRSEAAVVSIQPSIAAPEYAMHRDCRLSPPYSVRFVVAIGAGADGRALRGMRFLYEDRGGRNTQAIVTVTPPVERTAAGFPVPVTVPTSATIPVPAPGTLTLPSSSPVPFPGAPPFDRNPPCPTCSFLVPTVVDVECGGPDGGTIHVDVDIDGRDGASRRYRGSVAVRR